MLTPNHYKLQIEPDLATFTFDGMVSIHLDSPESVGEISLDARDLQILNCKITPQSGYDLDCAFSTNPDHQQLTIRPPAPVQGSFELQVIYSGQINDQYVGLYRSQFQLDGQTHYLATTQFEAKEARRVFPCIDQPGKKATFDIELVIDSALTGISNSDVIVVRKLADGKKLLRFARTPRMSTYLVFLGIGEFEFIEDRSQEPLVRVATTPGKTQYGQFALQMARKVLSFGESYTGVAYPLSKCDFIAVPDSLGAMENFGAIRHAEDVLLVYPEKTSKSLQTLIAKIIAHEGIHMWFGDLVSPAAWKYLWLNEAFATYFTYVIPHHYYPEWRVWEQFYTERMLTGLERDALLDTPAIDLPFADDPDADPAPTPSTAPVIYNKGAAVIRMLAAYLGEQNFRKGLQHFLEQYKFQAATSQQLWEAIEEATAYPVLDFAQAWVYQPGFPLVEVHKQRQQLILSQKRFAYSSNSSPNLWVIPVVIDFYLENGKIQTTQVQFSDRSMGIEMPENVAAFKLNAGLGGFYRTHYAWDDLCKLGELNLTGRLADVDALNLVNDLFALVKAGHAPIESYLDFVERYYSQEKRYLPLIDLAKNLALLYFVAQKRRPAVSQLGLAVFENALEALGYLPDEKEDLLTSELRNSLLGAAFLMGSERVAGQLKPLFTNLLAGAPVHHDIYPIAIQVGAAIDENVVEYLSQRAFDPETSESEKVMMLEALGRVRQADRLRQLLEKNLLETANSLKLHMILSAVSNPVAQEWLWGWFVEHLPAFEALPLARLEGLIVTLVPLCGLNDGEEVQTCLAQIKDRHPNASGSIAMALEWLDINRRIGER